MNRKCKLIIKGIALLGIVGWLSSCGGGDNGGHDVAKGEDIAVSAAPTSAPSTHFTVPLPCFPAGWFGESCEPAEITIPNGRPIYALLVSGFHVNKNMDLFHFYNFAKALQEKGAYVHYAWWNNLLAPYMEKPLHNVNSVPSFEALPWHDFDGELGFRWKGSPYPTKALPAEDNQFQADATALLTQIRANNPDAAIILVGHSMGGKAVARLADNIDSSIDIALLAPIDPVGNRTCLPIVGGAWCRGWDTFKRFYAVRRDDRFALPDLIHFGTNIKYLYHRWQKEFNPPFDYLFDEFFLHSGTLALFGVHGPGNSYQALIPTNPFSGFEAIPRNGGLWNSGGANDGHGEIVGYRGVIPFGDESYPVALKALGNWPSRDKELDLTNQDDDERLRRVAILREWETNPNYLRENGFEPAVPGYCMVSGDLITILNNKVTIPTNAGLVADAGPDQIIECGDPNGTEVMLDGSGSFHPNGDPLNYTWVLADETVMGETVSMHLPLGTHTVTLTVDDGQGNADPNTVVITVVDTTSPTLSVSLSPNSLWPPNHEMVSVTATIQVSDNCDASPAVTLVSILSNEADDDDHEAGPDDHESDDIQGAVFGTDDREFLLESEREGKGHGRIYTVIYDATDATDNAAVASADVTVPHDHGDHDRR